MPTEHFLASDAMALAGVTDQIVYLEEGDLVDLQPQAYWIVGKDRRTLAPAQRPVRTVQAHSGAVELGPYRHYMQRKFLSSPRHCRHAGRGRHRARTVRRRRAGRRAGRGRLARVLEIDRVLILACGTSYYSGCTAKYWLEELAGIPTQVEVASEYRYRTSVPDPRHLIVTISQSGETADTLAALRHAQSLGMEHTRSPSATWPPAPWCANASSPTSPARGRDRRGQHQGLHHAAGGPVPADAGAGAVQPPHRRAGGAHLKRPCATCPWHCRRCWHSNRSSSPGPRILPAWKTPCSWAGACTTPLPGRALKLKGNHTSTPRPTPPGSSSIGPLALVTSAMPVVTVAPNDALLEKLKSNMQEVRARGGVLYVLADADTRIESGEGLHVIRMPEHYGPSVRYCMWCRCSCWPTRRPVPGDRRGQAAQSGQRA